MRLQFGFFHRHPFMVQSLSGIDTFVRIDREASRDQVLGTTGNFPPELWSKVVLSIPSSIKDLIFIVIIEW